MIFFYKNFFKFVVNGKEPDPQFVISAPAPQRWSQYILENTL